MNIKEVIEEIKIKRRIDIEEAEKYLAGVYLYFFNISSGGWKIFIEKDTERYEVDI